MNDENGKVRKFDWGAVVVILFLIATLLAGIFCFKIL